MPIHDWTRTYASAFHHLHVTWLVEIARALNDGLLPPGYYAMGEQVIGGAVPDVLTLERSKTSDRSVEAPPSFADAGWTALPAATITAVAEAPRYLWGRPYIYELVGGKPRAACLGRDGAPGGADEDADLEYHGTVR